jgi:hypothetical protein
VLGRPSRPKDRTQPTKLEITFGHAFDRREVSSSKSAVRACVPSVFDQPSERAVLGVSGGVGRHEGALRDHPFSIASQRFENAMRQPRSVPLAGQLLRHLRVEQGEAAFSRRLRARRRRMAFQAGSLLDCPGYGRGKRGEPRVSGRTATDRGFAVRSAEACGHFADGPGAGIW